MESSNYKSPRWITAAKIENILSLLVCKPNVSIDSKISLNNLTSSIPSTSETVLRYVKSLN